MRGSCCFGHCVEQKGEAPRIGCRPKRYHTSQVLTSFFVSIRFAAPKNTAENIQHDAKNGIMPQATMSSVLLAFMPRIIKA